MNSEENQRANGVKHRRNKRSEHARVAQFSFGARRYTMARSRRLFTPQKSLLSAALEPDSERPNAILRVLSS